MRTLLSPFAKHDRRLRVARLEKAVSKLIAPKPAATTEAPTAEREKFEIQTNQESAK